MSKTFLLRSLRSASIFKLKVSFQLNLDDLFLIPFYIFLMEIDILGLLFISQLLPHLVTDLFGFLLRALVFLNDLHPVLFNVDLIWLRGSLWHDCSLRIFELLLDNFCRFYTIRIDKVAFRSELVELFFLSSFVFDSHLSPFSFFIIL